VQTWSVADLPFEPGRAAGSGVEVRAVVVPQRTAKCELLPGDPPEQVAALGQRLRDLKLL
jgi:hypothetical protein